MKSLFLWFASLCSLSIIIIISYRFDILGFRSNFALDFVDIPAHFFRKPIDSAGLCKEQKKALETKNQSLEKELVKIQQELMVRVDLTKESVEAEIINVNQDKMIINRGASSSVFVNNKAIIGQSLVGVILETEKKRSLVGLLHNPKTKVLCSAGGPKSKIWGLMTGKPDGKIYLTKILQTDKINKKDKVYCSGFYAGEVVRLIKNESDLFYEAEIVSKIIPENLEKVYVVDE